MKKFLSLSLTAALCLAPLSALCSCGPRADVVLRVASWEEYIDEGDEDRASLIEDFEAWYEEETGYTIQVKYVPLDDNETMYNKISLGEKYDLLCPSEYMIMKLQAEGKLEKYPESFFDTSVETNYYAKNVSPFIKETFENGLMADGSKWSEYAAGYLWGTTGFVVSPALSSEATSWNVVKNHGNRATAKNNVRDSYFMGLGMYYENELNSLSKDENYQSVLHDKMNDVSSDTMQNVKELLKSVKKSGVRFETDDAKDDIIAGEYDVSYQWSGDAVYILDEAEKNGIYYEYVVPQSASNLWFDGWVMLKGANVDAATAFVNFVSMSENAARNCDYVGYTPCIAGEEVLSYVSEKYGAKSGDTETATYDLTYFFSDSKTPVDKYILTVPKAQLKRQLFAQFPDVETKKRLVVMDYFTKEVNDRAATMWNEVSAN